MTQYLLASVIYVIHEVTHNLKKLQKRKIARRNLNCEITKNTCLPTNYAATPLNQYLNPSNIVEIPENTRIVNIFY